MRWYKHQLLLSKVPIDASATFHLASYSIIAPYNTQLCTHEGHLDSGSCGIVGLVVGK